MNTIDFKIVTPDGLAYDDKVTSVTMPTADGEITILANHIPLVTLLTYGEMTLKKDDHDVHFAVSRGIVMVKPHSEVRIMADTAERAEEIDIARAEVARERAQKMLEQKENLNDVDFARFQSIMERELARIKVGQRRR